MTLPVGDENRLTHPNASNRASMVALCTGDFYHRSGHSCDDLAKKAGVTHPPKASLMRENMPRPPDFSTDAEALVSSRASAS